MGGDKEISDLREQLVGEAKRLGFNVLHSEGELIGPYGYYERFTPEERKQHRLQWTLRITVEEKP